MTIKIIKEILDWSEVWATLIPLVVYFWVKPKAAWVRPLYIYLLIALVLSIVIDVTWKCWELGIRWWVEKTFWWLFKDEWFYNVVFYNINSFLRLLFFTWFFYTLLPAYKKVFIVITIMFFLGGLANYIFFENILFSFSSRLFTVEAAILLFYCLLYFYAVNMNDEIRSLVALAPFWSVMGLTLYASVNFLVFLFFNYLTTTERNYAIELWNAHNIIYIVLMIFIGVAFKKAKSTP